MKPGHACIRMFAGKLYLQRVAPAAPKRVSLSAYFYTPNTITSVYRFRSPKIGRLMHAGQTTVWGQTVATRMTDVCTTTGGHMGPPLHTNSLHHNSSTPSLHHSSHKAHTSGLAETGYIVSTTPSLHLGGHADPPLHTTPVLTSLIYRTACR